MPPLSTSLLLLANRLLPAVDLPGDADPMEYARWENRTAEGLLETYRSCPGRVDRALDVGCGYGGKTTRLREASGNGTEWVALDISQSHLVHAGRWFAESGHPQIRRARADAADLPFPDAAFDRIVSADALEHLPRPLEALREFRRCLAPGGRIVLLFNPWLSPRGSHLADLLRLPWCQAWFSKDTLVAATRAEGERRAMQADTPELEKQARAQAESLVDHFVHHVHPTRIADLRDRLAPQAGLSIESARHFGPGPLRDAPFVGMRWCEEFLSATYAAVLRPATDRSSDSRSASLASNP